MRVVGKVYGSDGYGCYLDDGSPYGVWVEYSDEVMSDGAVVGITVISTVAVDYTYGPARWILALPYLDNNLVVYRAP